MAQIEVYLLILGNIKKDPFYPVGVAKQENVIQKPNQTNKKPQTKPKQPKPRVKIKAISRGTHVAKIETRREGIPK